MDCPKCQGTTRVVGTVRGPTTHRFRKCTQCDATFQTIEAIRFDDYWREYARHSVEVDKDIDLPPKRQYA